MRIPRFVRRLGFPEGTGSPWFSGALLLMAAFGMLPGRAPAEVREVSADTFRIEIVVHIESPPARVYAALGEIGHWWNSEHTWSNDAANLTLVTEADGCFCERWSVGSVVHGHVIMAQRDRIVRLDAPLGPLQGRAVKAILTFELKESGRGTELRTQYLVNGSSASKLDQIAAPVDEVITEQVTRLKRYVETGRPSEANP